MARDMNRLLDDIRNSRSVFITPTGEIEDEQEAARNQEAERDRDGEPQPRTKLKPEIFGAHGDEVRIGADVLDAMRAEAATCEGETGGVVVGPARGVVTRLIPSGPYARRTPASYELDVAHLQPLVTAAEREGLRFLGVWHVHPKGVNELSSTDLRAAARMLGDADYGVDELLLPLSVRTRRGIETRMYRIARDCVGVESPTVIVTTPLESGAAPASPLAPRAGRASVMGVFSKRIERDIEALVPIATNVTTFVEAAEIVRVLRTCRGAQENAFKAAREHAHIDRLRCGRCK